MVSAGRFLDLEGALIIGVTPRSGADRAGLEPAYRDSRGRVVIRDVILELDGTPIRSEDDLVLALERREAASPPDPWLIALGRSCLGESLIEQGRYREAEPLVVDAFPIIFETSGTANHYGPEAIERVWLLYEKWGKPDKVEEWKRRWSELTEPPG